MIREVRSIVAHELAAISDLAEVPPATGAFYFFLKLAAKQSPRQLVEALIREHGVAAIPGDAFGHVEGCTIRISYGALKPENAREGMRRLTSGLRRICGAV
jgi:aspartate/methionine/tyrosine aminotransferase